MSFWDWLLRRRQHEADLDEEIQAHLVMAAQERVKQGEPAPEALTSATREFGNVALVKDVTREMWGFTWLETWLQDLRYITSTGQPDANLRVVRHHVRLLPLAAGHAGNRPRGTGSMIAGPAPAAAAGAW